MSTQPRIDIPRLAYSTEEAAAATGFTTSTIRAAIQEGGLVTRHSQGECVIRIQDLEDWLSALPATKGGRSTERQASKPLFRTPEEVAPELGISKTSLRSYCRISGICTRGSRNKIMIHQDDVPRLVEWIKERRKTEDEWWNTEIDHFSEGSKTRSSRQRDPFS